MGGHGGGRCGFGGAKIAETAATALGITADDLETELNGVKPTAPTPPTDGTNDTTVTTTG